MNPYREQGPGVMPHVHNFKEVPWDHDRLGPDVIGNYTATFKYLFRCACGEEQIRTSGGFI